MEEFPTSHSRRSNLLTEDDINNDSSDNDEMKGVTESLLTDAFFQNVLGSRGTVISWKPFEVRTFCKLVLFLINFNSWRNGDASRPKLKTCD